MTNMHLHNVKKITVGKMECAKSTRWRRILIEHEGGCHMSPPEKLEALKITLYIAEGDEDVEIVLKK